MYSATKPSLSFVKSVFGAWDGFEQQIVNALGRERAKYRIKKSSAVIYYAISSGYVVFAFYFIRAWHYDPIAIENSFAVISCACR
ncbi:MAG: hypothetical protein IPQ01_09625 [Zoogloea sp.]|nr:hypothetical protein [Zoogloea sp.]